MAYQEVKTTGYGTRLGNSFKGILSGLILFFLATSLLWWNEGRAVKTDKMLNDAEKACIEMENPEKKDASLEGELVCATALATTEDSLTDSQFGISAKTIALKRKVEYYQWIEHTQEKREDKLGGKEVVTTTYTYSKEWTSRPVESAVFKDPAYQQKNMVLTTVQSEDVWAANVSFGAYKLNDGLINCISSNEPYDLDINEDLLKELDKNAKVAYERFYGLVKTAKEPAQPSVATDSVKVANDSIQAINDSIQAATDSLLANADNKVTLEYIHQAGNMLYYGRVPGSPEIGDVRVTWEVIVPAKVTIISQVNGETFVPFKAKNGKHFQTLVMGKKDAAEIFEAEHDANNMLTWILRVIGILVVIAGIRGVLGIFDTILKVVPFIANIFGFGVGIVCFVIGLVWSLIIIALAWLFYRPLIGISLLVVAAFLIWFFAFRGKEKLKQLKE